jgi:hypothetical protein
MPQHFRWRALKDYKPGTNGTLTLNQSIVRILLAFGRHCGVKIH